MTQTNTEAAARLASDLRKRARMGEQAFQVEHYLALWKTYPTADNWQRVIDAVRAYAPTGEINARLRKGQRVYFLYERSGGRPGSNRTALARYTRIGARGKVYNQGFRKGSKSWTREA